MTPGITALEYHKRRSKLAASLPNNSIAILAASDTKYRSGAVFYEFHQDSNFFYLTGFNEPEATAVIQKVGQSGSGDYIFHLFVRPKDVKAESWDGARSGTQAALDVFNADHTGDISKLSSLLSPIIAGASEVFTDFSDTRSSFSKFFTGDSSHHEFQKMLQDSKAKPLRPFLNELRVFKSEAEVALMLSAGRISGRALTNAMCTKWKTEKELNAFLDYQFKIGGCDTTAYIPVIAGGKHALKIHYVRNDDVLHDGDMVLVDAGGGKGQDIERFRLKHPNLSPGSLVLQELPAALQTISVHESITVMAHNLFDEQPVKGIRSFLNPNFKHGLTTHFQRCSCILHSYRVPRMV